MNFQHELISLDFHKINSSIVNAILEILEKIVKLQHQLVSRNLFMLQLHDAVPIFK